MIRGIQSTRYSGYLKTCQEIDGYKMLKREDISYKEPSVVLKQNRIIRTLFSFIILASAVLIFAFGGYIGQQFYTPRVVTQYEVITVDRIIEKVTYTPVEKVIETVVYKPVDKIVYTEVEKPVVKKVEIARPLTYFENINELKQWLSDVNLVQIGFNVIDQNNHNITKFDCDDYARNLQDKALQDGYIISFEVIRASEYNSTFKEKKIPSGAIHAVNSAIIGNEVYYIEPQTREIVFVANID